MLGVVAGSVWLFYTKTPYGQAHAQDSPYDASMRINEFEQAYHWWKKTVETRPEYLDGYIMASYYARRLGKQEESQALLQKALIMDPNNKKIKMFLERQ